MRVSDQFKNTMPILVVRIEKLIPHPHSEILEVAQLEGGSRQSVVTIGEYSDGCLAGYFPEGAILPTHILRSRGYWNEEKGIGTLGGTYGNRVKPTRMRGVLSDGICYPLCQDAKWEVGNDIASWLGFV